MKRLAALAALSAALGGLAVPQEAVAAPDPTIAVLLGAGGTAIPLAVSGALLFAGRGYDEGIRFDLGLAFLAVGASVGPSFGKIYAEGGGDAWVTFLLRTATTAILTTGVGLSLRGDTEGLQTAGNALSVLGGIPTGLLAIYDIATSASSAVEAGRRRGHERRAEILLRDEEIFGALSLCHAHGACGHDLGVVSSGGVLSSGARSSSSGASDSSGATGSLPGLTRLSWGAEPSSFSIAASTRFKLTRALE